MTKKRKFIKGASFTLNALGILLIASAVPIANSEHAFADSTESLKNSSISQVNDLSSITTYNLTLHIGDGWKFNNNLDVGSNKAGAGLDFTIGPGSSTIGGMSTLLGTSFTYNIQDPTGILVNGKVVKAGTFQVQYHFGVNLQKTATATITVLPNTFSAKDSTIYSNEAWTPSDNFTGGLDLKLVTVSGTVNTHVPGVYPVTYSYAGQSKTVNVTVKENKVGVVSRNLTLHVGDTWNTFDNFAGYVDREGQVTIFDNNFHVPEDIFKQIAPNSPHGTSFGGDLNILQGNKVVKPGQFSVTYMIYGMEISNAGSNSYPFRSATGTITVLP